VLLHDPKTDEFFIPAAAFDDAVTAQRFARIRFPAEKGAAGQVFQSGEPVIVAEVTEKPVFPKAVAVEAGFTTRSA
jgi:hypothetical protein